MEEKQKAIESFVREYFEDLILNELQKMKMDLITTAPVRVVKEKEEKGEQEVRVEHYISPQRRQLLLVIDGQIEYKQTVLKNKFAIPE